jgi:bifunctional non-homologous end joining protein LigD
MPRFVVHEHHASRLHWDFRLELGGALASWAVPKGPSMDPAHRRLAVRVEDHELSYIDFQGTIEEGGYGAGEVLIWDRGEFTLLSGGVGQGRMEFELMGEKLRGAFALFLMKGKEKEWLLVKKRDAHEQRGFTLRQALAGD